VRSAILIFLVILTFATTPARAQGTWLETRITRAICSGAGTPVAKAFDTGGRIGGIFDWWGKK